MYAWIGYLSRKKDKEIITKVVMHHVDPRGEPLP
jgi:hypothetical protein